MRLIFEMRTPTLCSLKEGDSWVLFCPPLFATLHFNCSMSLLLNGGLSKSGCFSASFVTVVSITAAEALTARSSGSRCSDSRPRLHFPAALLFVSRNQDISLRGDHSYHNCSTSLL